MVLSCRVVKMRSTTSCRNTVMAILYPEKLDNIDSIRCLLREGSGLEL